MQILKKIIQNYGKTIGIILFLIFTFVSGNVTGFLKNNYIAQTQVLSATTHVVTPTPPAGVSPTPTIVPVTIINNIIVPTEESTATPQIQSTTPTSTPSLIPIATPTPSVMPTEILLTPTPTLTSSTPTPTPISQSITLEIDYAGEHTESNYTVPVTPGETAWQAVQDGVGVANIHDTDYGGNLGIFITGFNGIEAGSNQYYDFQVNGISSQVGVSSYTVQDKDVLKFVLTSF